MKPFRFSYPSIPIIKRACAWILCGVSIVSCAFVPTIDREQRYADKCNMYTKRMTLTTVPLNNINCSGQDADACLLVWAIGAPATTFVVSGSVVLVGNTLHWVEFQGTCEDGAVAEYVRLFKEKFNKT